MDTITSQETTASSATEANSTTVDSESTTTSADSESTTSADGGEPISESPNKDVAIDPFPPEKIEELARKQRAEEQSQSNSESQNDGPDHTTDGLFDTPTEQASDPEPAAEPAEPDDRTVADDDDADADPDYDKKIPIKIDNDEISGTILVDPAQEAVPHIIETNHPKNRVADVKLDGPTLAPNGTDIFARPAIDYTLPRATRWYGLEETTKDWMTPLNTATESNPEYESEVNEENDIDSPETMESLFSHLENASEPTAYQVVFQAREDWSERAQDRKQNIRSGNFDEPWLEKWVFAGYETDEHRDLKAYEYWRIRLIETKRHKKIYALG